MRNTATSRILHLPESTPALGKSSPWFHPLPRLDGLAPTIIPAEKRPPEDAARFGYADQSSSSHFVPVFAARDGVITCAFRTDHRATLCLDHPGGWSTQYDGLESVIALSTDRFRRRRKVRVRGGDVLGHIRSPLRVRFTLIRLVDGEWTCVDPASVMRSWTVLPWTTDRIACDAAAIAV